MPTQTTKKGYLSYPDGGKVSVKKTAAGPWLDVGAIIGSLNFTLNYTENQTQLANAGKTDRQIRDMVIAGGFTLVNTDPEVLEYLSGGMFTIDTQTGSLVSSIEDQVIADGDAVNKQPVPLHLVETGANPLKLSAEPTITSVTGSVDSALAENDDYTIIKDLNSSSGYSIVFNTAGTTLSTMAQDFTIVYASATPIAGDTLHAGTSTLIQNAYGLKIEHRNSDAVIDNSFEVYAANTDSGGFVFGYKGADEDGLNEMPISFTGDLDTTRADGKQLFNHYRKASA
jgi:hypothetical protein